MHWSLSLSPGGGGRQLAGSASAHQDAAGASPAADPLPTLAALPRPAHACGVQARSLVACWPFHPDAKQLEEAIKRKAPKKWEELRRQFEASGGTVMPSFHVYDPTGSAAEAAGKHATTSNESGKSDGDA